MYLSVVIALVLSVGLFMLLPTVAVGLLGKLTENIIILNLAEGAVRIAIFIAYIALISKMEDIKTVFQYHGAEHRRSIASKTALSLHQKTHSSSILFIQDVELAL